MHTRNKVHTHEHTCAHRYYTYENAHAYLHMRHTQSPGFYYKCWLRCLLLLLLRPSHSLASQHHPTGYLAPSKPSSCLAPLPHPHIWHCPFSAPTGTCALSHGVLSSLLPPHSLGILKSGKREPGSVHQIFSQVFCLWLR